MDIFPAGWCEKHGHNLQPPLGHTVRDFNWNINLKQTKTAAAPKNLYSNRSGNVSIEYNLLFVMFKVLQVLTRFLKFSRKLFKLLTCFNKNFLFIFYTAMNFYTVIFFFNYSEYVPTVLGLA